MLDLVLSDLLAIPYILVIDHWNSIMNRISYRMNYRFKPENMSFNIFMLFLVILTSSRNQAYGDAEGLSVPDIHEDAEDHEPSGPRKFEYCHCHQKLRTSYLTTDVCGKAALCYWEIWNYNLFKANATRTDYHEECDKYMVQKYACLIGYPKPHHPNQACQPAVLKCDEALATMLYKECEPLREKRGLAKPEDVDWRVGTSDLNYDVNSDESRIFEARPISSAPTHNNFYTISCPIIYRFPYFTIDLLLRALDPEFDEYDETLALEGVGNMLPRYVREGIDQERILNFEALSLDESMINWCEIPTKYLCIKQELDPAGDICEWEKMNALREKCEPTEPMPRDKPLTPVALTAELDDKSKDNSTDINNSTLNANDTVIGNDTLNGNGTVIGNDTINS